MKIRSDEEIDNYNEEFFNEEKRQLKKVDGFTLIDYIKSAIEVLMNMKVEEQDEMENPDLFGDSSQLLPRSINRHERSAKSPIIPRKRNSTASIENKQIDVRVRPIGNREEGSKEDDDGQVLVVMPEMDSQEGGERSSPDKRK